MYPTTCGLYVYKEHLTAHLKEFFPQYVTLLFQVCDKYSSFESTRLNSDLCAYMGTLAFVNRTVLMI